MQQYPQACRAAGQAFDDTLVQCQEAGASFKELAAEILYNAHCHDATDIRVQQTEQGGVVQFKAKGRLLTFRHLDKADIEPLLDAFADAPATHGKVRNAVFTVPAWQAHAAALSERYRFRVEMSPGQALVRLIPVHD